jgi:hypothetical protein
VGIFFANDGDYVFFLMPDKIKGTPNSEIRPNEERGRIDADNDTSLSVALYNIVTPALLHVAFGQFCNSPSTI